MSTFTKVLRHVGKFCDPLHRQAVFRSHLTAASLSHSQIRMSSSEPASISSSIEAKNEPIQVTDEENEDFATMLRNSKLFQLGHYEGKIVEGVIQKVVGDDLYIDFGGKFHCVCQKPQTNNPRRFLRGQKVRVRLQELELSTRFLGATKDLTLCEADAILVGTATRARV